MPCCCRVRRAAGPADVRPFLENVLRGRRVAPERVEEVAHHYELFGGVSPLTELTQAQAAGCGRGSGGAGRALPVHVGMRNWHPFLADTLAEMSRAGVRRAVGVLAAAHRSYSGCLQYKENVRDARAALREQGLATWRSPTWPTGTSTRVHRGHRPPRSRRRSRGCRTPTAPARR